jgi:hypothetical protein
MSCEKKHSLLTAALLTSDESVRRVLLDIAAKLDETSRYLDIY